VKLTTEIQYGLRSLCDIVYHGAGTVVQVNSISERQDISPRYIEQIFQKLKKGGIVKSVRGPAGGYFLTRRPEKISVGDIIRAVEGKSICLVDCKGGERGRKPCDRLEKCVVSGIWDEASKILVDYFESVTLKQICEEARERGVGI
jgi:Rrf2 family transcriptional regulator, iron-sulfur cluster assembly transcription factor